MSCQHLQHHFGVHFGLWDDGPYHDHCLPYLDWRPDGTGLLRQERSNVMRADTTRVQFILCGLPRLS